MIRGTGTVSRVEKLPAEWVVLQKNYQMNTINFLSDTIKPS